MNKVILKHHEKETKMAKAAKEKKAMRAYTQDQQKEKALLLNNKIREIGREKRER